MRPSTVGAAPTQRRETWPFAAHSATRSPRLPTAQTAKQASTKPGTSHGRKRSSPRIPGFARPVGRLSRSRGSAIGHAFAERRKQAEQEKADLLRGVMHLRDARRRHGLIAEQERRAEAQLNRDDKRWEERVRQSHLDMLKRLEAARQHFSPRAQHSGRSRGKREGVAAGCVGSDSDGLGKRMVADPASKSEVIRHQKRWLAFEREFGIGATGKHQSQHDDGAEIPRRIRLKDVPFPPVGNPLCLLDPKNVSNSERAPLERKLAFRRASLKWHPDKFFARYGHLIQDGERAAISRCVQETFNRACVQRDRHVKTP